MEFSQKPIIEHIPFFLDYCRKIGLSQKSQENYKRFLKNFINWLKLTQKEKLKPHQLTNRDIQQYKEYLSQLKYSNRPLKKTTQNYYLIALRALLNYFASQNINAPSAISVKLLKTSTHLRKNNGILTLKQIEKILSLPNLNTEIGLRDKAILETLIFSGLKVSQLINLNKDRILNPNNNLSKRSLFWIKKYLRARKDKNQAVFINYRDSNKTNRRLTARSIERIVKKYSKQANLPSSVTPEFLRKAYVLALLRTQEKIKIIHPFVHKKVIKNNYHPPLPFISNSQNVISKKNNKTVSSSHWYFVENIINKEIAWLKNNLLTFPEGYNRTSLPLNCNECLFRKIAILIVSGQIKALEIQAKNKDLWNNLTNNFQLKNITRHGEQWHRKMIEVIYKYFNAYNYQIEIEPILNYGRADLGIYSNNQKPIYIEVGKVSLYKLWYNLSSMQNVIFLIIPSENKIIELKT